MIKFLLLAVLTLVKCNEDEVDFYEKLIDEEIEKSLTYRIPENANAYRPQNIKPIYLGNFDFIVVGSGSAGSVVASRLSEKNEWTVLLLEAGKEGNNFTDIPSMSTHLFSSEYNWGFNSTQQNTCCLAMNGFCPFPRGKSLGGTTMLNALVYARGNALDYDKWNNLGNPGWSYKDVLPFFKKSENSHIDGDAGYHGEEGYLDVSYHTPTSQKTDIFLKANQENGHSILDYNGKEQLGTSRTHFTTRNGKRLTTATAFLKPAQSRRNLKLQTESYVTKLITSSINRKVTGVEFSQKNIKYVVGVNKEVILSAGVVGSPQILMLSGIGPKDHLLRHRIRVQQDLQVGKNMHDHLTFYNMYFMTNLSEPLLAERDAIREYLNGTGPLTISTNPQGISFFTLGANHSLPELEVVFIPSIHLDGYDMVKKGAVQGYVDSEYKSYIEERNPMSKIMQIVVVLLHPKTRGSIALKSKDPFEYPEINSACLADPGNEDVEKVYEGIQKVLKLLDTQAFKKLEPVLMPYPACKSEEYLSKDYWICVIRQTAMNAYHGAGTCSMGADPSKGAVVNNKLKVYGFRNLRVADASVIPITLSGHMSAPSIMIGERAAAFITEEHT